MMLSHSFAHFVTQTYISHYFFSSAFRAQSVTGGIMMNRERSCRKRIITKSPN